MDNEYGVYGQICLASVWLLVLMLAQDSQNTHSVFGLILAPSKSADKAVFGNNTFTLTCTYTLQANERLYYLQLKRQRQGQPNPVNIMFFNDGVNATYQDGGDLSSRTVATPLSNGQVSGSVQVQFSSIACVDKAMYYWEANYFTGTGASMMSNNINVPVTAISTFAVNIPPVFSPSASLKEGDNVTFTCSGDIGGDPQGVYTWRYFSLDGSNTDISSQSSTQTAVYNDASCSYSQASSVVMKMRKEFDNIVVRCSVEQPGLGLLPRYRQTNQISVQSLGSWTSWGVWGPCSNTCGAGRRSRSRSCIYRDLSDTRGQDPCLGPSVEIRFCFNSFCPVDGKWGAWSLWSNCSLDCGGGTRSRNRSCVFGTGFEPHGADCTGNATEVLDCNMQACAVDGNWTEWSSWGSCSVSCGSGVEIRTRSCYFPPSAIHGSGCVGSSTENKTCTKQSCPRWNSWSEWGACSVTCNVGLKSRNRTCKYDPVAPQGTICVGASEDKKICAPGLCAIDGKWKEWQDWGPCSTTCGNGTEMRERHCAYVIPGAPHGKDCVGEANETRECTNTTECPGWNSWSEWGACSVTCNVGLKSRNRTCKYDPVAPQGTICVGASEDKKICAPGLCAIDGKWKEWQDWGPCSTTCGNGTEMRERRCAYVIPGAPHGKDCVGEANETRECTNTTECPVDGKWTEWSSWTSCSMSCGSGVEFRTRNCYFPSSAVRGSDCVGNSSESKTCTKPACPPTTPPPPHSCYQCLVASDTCEDLTIPMLCDPRLTHCINNITNFNDGSRLVERRCGTLDQCINGWYQKYSGDHRCVRFNEEQIYTSAFYCEFCCTDDDCNEYLNMPNKYHP